MASGLRTTTYLEQCNELKLETLEKRRVDQDMALVYKLANEEIFRSSKVINFFRGNIQPATRMTAELKNLISLYDRTELRKASFALGVTGKWNQVPAVQKNASSSKLFHRMKKRDRE
jgi:hypothetical protein